jgi:hypothetical protein
MYKPRNKYITTNQKNIVPCIMGSDAFTPYEFMSLRYACCELIAKEKAIIERAGRTTKEMPLDKNATDYIRHLKIHIKALQRCIQHLDSIGVSGSRDKIKIKYICREFPDNATSFREVMRTYSLERMKEWRNRDPEHRFVKAVRGDEVIWEDIID